MSATEEMFARDRRRQRTSTKTWPLIHPGHSLSMAFPRLNLFDLLLFSVLPTETMNNLRFA